MSLGHLLLVDDEQQILRALRPALAAAGFEVATAETGGEALAHLASEACDVVILDLGLPDMDGKEVIGRIREWSEVPILVLSARDLEHEKIAALDQGADDFINKPFGVEGSSSIFWRSWATSTRTNWASTWAAGPHTAAIS